MPRDKSGRSLELAVKQVQELLDPNSTVTHDESIVDHLGNARQFDVVVRGSVGGRPILGVIECKDWNDKVGIPEVEAFSKKAKSINANFLLMVSRRGFYEPGLKLAKFEGIGTYSLIPDGSADETFSLGTRWYMRAYKWVDMMGGYMLAPRSQVPLDCDPARVMLGGKPVFEWFAREFDTTHSGIKSGEVRIEHRFKKPTVLDFNGTPSEVAGLFATARRVCENHSKFVCATGLGYYNWDAKQVEMPADQPLTFELTRQGFRDWEPYGGEISDDLMKPPPVRNPGSISLTMCFDVAFPLLKQDTEVIDLTAY